MARRAKATLVGAAFLVLGTGTAHAQLDDATIVGIVRECRKLPDEAARVACYDNIPIGEPVAGPSAASGPPPSPAAQAPVSQAPAAPVAGGFGSSQLPRPADAVPAEPKAVSARVSAAVERLPGVYLLTLEDGAQWEFVDAVPKAYDPPRPGETIELIGASLGSYLMRYAGQRGVRIRRVR